MKKKAISIAVLIVVFAMGIFFLVCNDRDKGGDIGNVQRTISTSEFFSEQDINEAMDIVEKKFISDFKGCILTDLWYDESVSVSESDEWSKQYDADESIVLLSTFDVDSSGGDGSFNPNDTYSNWNWILVRNKGSEWELKTWGY